MLHCEMTKAKSVRSRLEPNCGGICGHTQAKLNSHLYGQPFEFAKDRNDVGKTRITGKTSRGVGHVLKPWILGHLNTAKQGETVV